MIQTRIPIVSRPATLVLAALVFVRFGHAQSPDDVHIVPRSTADQSAPAQITAPSDDNLNVHMQPLRVDVDVVLVPVTVTDATNRAVTDLQKQNFTVFDGNEQQAIQYFSKEDAPVSVGLVLDVSRSMANKIDVERAAVTEFFKNANPQDDYFVVTLSDRPRLVSDTTQSLDEIQRQLALVVPEGNTALLDGIYVAVGKLKKSRYRRRALIIISDGGDNHSYYKSKVMKKLAEEADVLMYSIGIIDNMPVPAFKTIEEKLGKRLLTHITEASGGRTIVADSRAKVPEIAAAISREIRTQYVLGYRTTEAMHDGKWRKIKVFVKANTRDSNLRAYYKPGYFAPGK